MLPISNDVIQNIIEQNDIVDVVSEFVRLKKAGRDYKGLCPFHHEKTPSFNVLPEKQIFKCFGCGEGGNVITFIMKYKNISFIDAIKFLADRANIDISYSNGNPRKKDENERLYNLNVEAARYYYRNLKINKNAKKYLLNRGIEEKTIVRFGLGYALDDWHGVKNYILKKGYSELDLLNAGLILKSEKGNTYDRFRNRIIYPVFDYKGRVIGFGGRVLDNSVPKYLNSPETNIFKKGTNLYGLNFAIREKQKYFVLVEGYMDCISLHQFGINSAVASLGTALTVNQARLLKRYVSKVIISYDADFAGQTATLRGLNILRKQGLDVKVLKVPQGKDPDEYIRNNGRESFLKLIENAANLIDYILDRAADETNFKEPGSTSKYYEKIIPILNSLNPIEKDSYINKISEKTGIKEQAIYDMIKIQMQKNVNKDNQLNIHKEFGQKLYIEPAYIKAERSILKLFYMKAIDEKYLQDRNFSPDDFVLESHKKLYNLIQIYHESKDSSENSIMLSVRDTDSAKEWANIEEMELVYNSGNLDKILIDCIREIKKYKLEEQKKLILEKIKECESKNAVDEYSKYAKKLIELKKLLGGNEQYGRR